MTDRAFTTRLQGHGLTTAEILYHRPDAPSLLQLFVWQDYRLAPDFPALFDFVDFWNREIEAALHSIRIAHDHLLRPAHCRAVHDQLRSHLLVLSEDRRLGTVCVLNVRSRFS